jgi:hypothetical protein
MSLVMHVFYSAILQGKRRVNLENCGDIDRAPDV